MLELTISSPPVTGFKHVNPAAVQRCPLPPWGRWKGPNPALLFYSIQGGTFFSLSLSPISVKRGEALWHAPGWNPCFYVPLVWHECISCLGEKSCIFLQNPFGSGGSVSLLVVLHQARARQPVGLRLQEKPLLLHLGWWLLKLSYLNFQFFCSTEKNSFDLLAPYWTWLSRRIFLSHLLVTQ